MCKGIRGWWEWDCRGRAHYPKGTPWGQGPPHPECSAFSGFQTRWVDRRTDRGQESQGSSPFCVATWEGKELPGTGRVESEGWGGGQEPEKARRACVSTGGSVCVLGVGGEPFRRPAASQASFRIWMPTPDPPVSWDHPWLFRAPSIHSWAPSRRGGGERRPPSVLPPSPGEKTLLPHWSSWGPGQSHRATPSIQPISLELAAGSLWPFCLQSKVLVSSGPQPRLEGGPRQVGRAQKRPSMGGSKAGATSPH